MTWFWRESSPVQALPAGRTLVVADLGPFTLHYGFDDWDPATVTGVAQPIGNRRLEGARTYHQENPPRQSPTLEGR